MANPVLLLLSLLSISFPLPIRAVLDPAEILANSGFVSMALTLKLVSDSLIPQNSSLTIFSPPDSAFAQSGQPPLSLLQLHFSPIRFSYEGLQSFPYGTKIPTLFTNHSLIITTSASDDQISLNGVKIYGSPIYDDGYLIIFGIENFFDLNFQVPARSSVLGCIAPEKNNKTSFSNSYSFDEASGLLRSRGYSVMASLLDMQLHGFKNQTALTVFAPLDASMADHIGNFSELSLIFRRHIVPCKLSLTDLVSFDGLVLKTYLDGFTINIARSDGILMLNNVPILIYPDMYITDWLVVHGVSQILSPAERSEQLAKRLSEIRGTSKRKKRVLGEF